MICDQEAGSNEKAAFCPFVCISYVYIFGCALFFEIESRCGFFCTMVMDVQFHICCQ